MTPELHVVAGPDKGRVFAIPEADPLLVGRSKTTQTQLNDPHVSRVHCRVQRDGDLVLLTDADSAGGTFVNNKRVTQQHVQHGDVIRIGDTQLRLVSGVAP